MDFSQSALLFDLSFQSVILHLLISVCIQLHQMLLVVNLVDFPEDYCEILDLFLFYHSFYLNDQSNSINLSVPSILHTSTFPPQRPDLEKPQSLTIINTQPISIQYQITDLTTYFAGLCIQLA